jgi:hypothetical protein
MLTFLQRLKGDASSAATDSRGRAPPQSVSSRASVLTKTTSFLARSLSSSSGAGAAAVDGETIERQHCAWLDADSRAVRARRVDCARLFARCLAAATQTNTLPAADDDAGRRRFAAYLRALRSHLTHLRRHSDARPPAQRSLHVAEHAHLAECERKVDFLASLVDADRLRAEAQSGVAAVAALLQRRAAAAAASSPSSPSSSPASSAAAAAAAAAAASSSAHREVEAHLRAVARVDNARRADLLAMSNDGRNNNGNSNTGTRTSGKGSGAGGGGGGGAATPFAARGGARARRFREERQRAAAAAAAAVREQKQRHRTHRASRADGLDDFLDADGEFNGDGVDGMRGGGGGGGGGKDDVALGWSLPPGDFNDDADDDRQRRELFDGVRRRRRGDDDDDDGDDDNVGGGGGGGGDAALRDEQRLHDDLTVGVCAFLHSRCYVLRLSMIHLKTTTKKRTLKCTTHAYTHDRASWRR